MATEHVVLQGEHLSKISAKYGFLDYRTIWDHPQNADLNSGLAAVHLLKLALCGGIALPGYRQARITLKLLHGARHDSVVDVFQWPRNVAQITQARHLPRSRVHGVKVADFNGYYEVEGNHRIFEGKGCLGFCLWRWAP